jgi:hypothetical protein
MAKRKAAKADAKTVVAEVKDTKKAGKGKKK